MPCYHPINGYRSKSGRNENGSWPIVFNPSSGYIDMPITVPCGRCIGCRLEKSRQWAIRCIHEASLHEDNCFITLTYSNESLPKSGSLDKTHFQKFMKRLRKKFGEKIRFFHCGEYGDSFSRPHYHALLFNHDFKDRYIYKLNKKTNEKYYRSDSLEKIWKYGYSIIGDVTFESAAYVSRYILKKVNGKKAVEHYNNIDTSTGLVLKEFQPEYITMSRRPGIGRNWIDTYMSDVYPADQVVVRNNLKSKPPRYYDDVYDNINHKSMTQLKSIRRAKAEEKQTNSTNGRLIVREQVQEHKARKLIRAYEKD